MTNDAITLAIEALLNFTWGRGTRQYQHEQSQLALAALRAEQDKPSLEDISQSIDVVRRVLRACGFDNVKEASSPVSIIQSYGDQQWRAGYEAAREQDVSFLMSAGFRSNGEPNYSFLAEKIAALKPEVKND